jgi:hypothetical protein
VTGPSEVGHSKDHNNYSPFHHAVLVLHAHDFGAVFDSFVCFSSADDVT